MDIYKSPFCCVHPLFRLTPALLRAAAALSPSRLYIFIYLHMRIFGSI